MDLLLINIVSKLLQDFVHFPAKNRRNSYIRIVQKIKLIGLLTLLFVSCADLWTTRVSLNELEIDSLSQPRTYIYENKPFTGIVEILSNQNQLLQEIHVLNGIEEGVQKIYDSISGNLTAEKNMSGGILQGLSTYYWPDGNISQTHEFVQGRLGGKSTFYHRNGKIRLQMQFSPSGNKTGTWYEYDLQGKIIKQTKYD